MFSFFLYYTNLYSDLMGDVQDEEEGDMEEEKKDDEGKKDEDDKKDD